MAVSFMPSRRKNSSYGLWAARCTNQQAFHTIYDLSVPRMAFGRVCILGDAAFVSRPHTAAGLSKAATNAVALANFIANSSNVDVVETLKR
jgi:2,6-dihydroxypyridine 3-monooxygenase